MENRAHSMDEVVEQLSDLFPLLWDAAEVGCQEAQNYFKKNKVDRFLAPNIFRYHMKQYIQNNKWKVLDLETDYLSGNGLLMHYRNYHIRVWKEQGRELPDPGVSEIKNAFLRQIHSFQQPGLWEEEQFADNLALLWDTDKNYNLVRLRLAHPESDPSGVERVFADWSIILEHPANKIGNPPNAIIDETQFDLPIEPFTSEEDSIGANHQG